MDTGNQPKRSTLPASGASHLVNLAEGWTTWRSFCLRSAGFPIDRLEKIAAPAAVAAIDRMLDCQAAFDDAGRQALEICRRRVASANETQRRLLLNMSRSLAKGRVPAPAQGVDDLDEALVALAAAETALKAAGQSARDAAAQAIAESAEVLRDVASEARFREAVTWQNRKALQQGIGALLRSSPEPRNAKLRSNEQLVTSYLQRYCAKNESIGFFGPRVWASWSDDGPPLRQSPGGQLVSASFVHFEYWAIDALCRAMTREPDLRPWLKPRLSPLLRIGKKGYIVDRNLRRRRLVPDVWRLLRACTGARPARDLAAELLARPDCSFPSEAAIFDALAQLAGQGHLSWSLDVPVSNDPESQLRQELEQLGEPALRARLLARLDAFEEARAAVASAQGDAEALYDAFERLEQNFTAQTGSTPYQHDGRIYAGRTLLYHDCRRALDLEVGPEIRRRVAAPLALILQSARWYSHEIAARFEQELRRLFLQLQEQFAPAPVPVLAFEPLFQGRDQMVISIVRDVVRELTKRWQAILAPKPRRREMRLSSAALRDGVQAAFAAPCPGWSAARHHSADILLAANSPAEAAEGRLECILGEIHVTDTMILRQAFQEAHPHPEELFEAYRRDVDQTHIFRTTSRDFVGHRKQWNPFLPGDLQLAKDASPALRDSGEVLRLADLVIEERADGLTIRDIESDRSFPAMIYFERLLWREAFSEFKLLPAAAHSPRIRLDDMVIQRESWSFLCRDLGFVFEKSETDRFIGARRWARALGLPRWLFARFPQEMKPVYVDFHSPASIEVMAKLTRRAQELLDTKAALRLSEMLPDPTQAWLTDGEGRRYTSELRIVAVDPEPWRGGPAD